MTKELSSDINDRQSRRKLKTLSIYTINLPNNDLFYYYSYSICPIFRFFRLQIFVMRWVKNFTKCAIFYICSKAGLIEIKQLGVIG